MPGRTNTKVFFFFCVTVILFYWKILLTHQYSLLAGTEGVNLSYAFSIHWIRTLWQGGFPLWNPFEMAGRSFAGDMQAAPFNPLHLLLALVPFNKYGLLAPGLYDWWFALIRLLGAVFMYALARELRLSPFSSIIAGIGFSLGGFVGRLGWPPYFESAIWIPLVVLFFLRALLAETRKAAILNANWSGLFMGLGLLIGGLHSFIMQGLALAGAAVFASLNPRMQTVREANRSWVRPALALVVAGVSAGCAAAVQLLASIDYSRHAIRFITAGVSPASEAIPYAQLKADYLYPNGIMTLLFPMAFNGQNGAGEAFNPYLGIFPLLASVIAVWKCWGNPWVRYLAILATCAFLYTFGPFSFLHGVMYALIPKLWLAREASRFIYLADFALALLAGFGTQVLFERGLAETGLKALTRIFSATVAVCAAIVLVPAVIGQPGISPWTFLSILTIIAVYGLYRRIIRGNTGAGMRATIVALLLCDLGGLRLDRRQPYRSSEDRRRSTRSLDQRETRNGFCQTSTRVVPR
jgi:hypothetical protein